MRTVITTHDLHQLATMCHDRAEAYRAPYVTKDEQNSFVTSTSYPIYAMLQELWLMLNKFADNLDEATTKGEEG